VPLFLKRSSSFSWSAAEAEEKRRGRITSDMLMRYIIGFFMMISPCAISNHQTRLCYDFRLIAEKQESATASPDRNLSKALAKVRQRGTNGGRINCRETQTG
jgi:hypothetical protein